jgi:5-methylcytosine-specific restriction endonuclease McrA
MTGRCELCQRDEVDLTRHHLVPRTRHANKRNQRDFAREDVRTRIAMFCRPCHKMVHALFTEKQLEREFNTLERIAAHPDVGRFVEWIRTKPAGFHSTTRKSSITRSAAP